MTAPTTVKEPTQIDEFRRGTIMTQKELGLPASQFFMTPQRVRGKREEALASELLDLLKRLRQRLLAEFDKAKTDTGGKKRIRFLLK